MDLSPFLSPADADRAHRTLSLLCHHHVPPFVLTGSLAVQIHLLRVGHSMDPRPPNDIDFLAGSFDEFPQTLADDFFFCHVHPHQAPGRTLLQCIDPQTAVRIDIFHALGNTMLRAIPFKPGSRAIRIVSLADLTAYTARLCMSLAEGATLPHKHAQDFLRLLPVISNGEIEPVWREHRKPNHPESFAEAALLLQHLIASRKDLQVVTKYAQDIRTACPHCEQTEAFPLAERSRIPSLLGYC